MIFVRDTASRGVRLPQRRLAGFRKVEIPAGGETEVSVTILPELLAYTDEEGRERTEEGVFEVETGGAAGRALFTASFRLV